MMRRSLTSIAALTAAMAALLLVRAPVAGQAQSPAAKATQDENWWTPRRTSDSKPDLQGIWNTATVTPLERPKGLGAKEFYTDEEFAKLSTRIRQGDVGEEAELGAARENALRYDISLYGGFDVTKARFASNKPPSLIVRPARLTPPLLPQAPQRNA